MILIILVTPRNNNGLCTIIWIDQQFLIHVDNECPLPTLHAKIPSLSNQNTLFFLWIILWKNRSKMVRWSSDMYPSTGSISHSALLCPLRCICFIRSVLVMHVLMIFQWSIPRSSYGHLGHSDDEYK